MKATFSSIVVVVFVSLFGLWTTGVQAELIGTYVDATTTNTTGTINPWDGVGTPNEDTDNLWKSRPDKNSVTWISSLYEGNNTESNKLTTTITIPSAGTYDIYVVHTAAVDPYPGWGIAGALSGNTLVGFYQGSAAGVGIQTGYVQESASHLPVCQALVGQVTVGAGGSVSIDVDTLKNYGGSARSRYHGVAYNAVPEPGTIMLLSTGLLGLLAYAWRKRR